MLFTNAWQNHITKLSKFLEFLIKSQGGIWNSARRLRYSFFLGFCLVAYFFQLWKLCTMLLLQPLSFRLSQFLMLKAVNYCYKNSPSGMFEVQKQPSRGVLRKRCSESVHQIYWRTPMPKCDLNKIAFRLY